MPDTDLLKAIRDESGGFAIHRRGASQGLGALAHRARHQGRPDPRVTAHARSIARSRRTGRRQVNLTFTTAGSRQIATN
ncbi:hypothetical protein BSU04_26925 [Caballeronia sordidicola]|uniref:Uncharacterized protein n=1 Tax=Caballeronia sordidicola TaxID=196367 RepID=A0A226WWC7_CABSO|nr:hypothetical protein BSU04_26925 [Caballeronia sordidicola]